MAASSQKVHLAMSDACACLLHPHDMADHAGSERIHHPTRLPPLDVWCKPRLSTDKDHSRVEKREEGIWNKQQVTSAFASFLVQLCGQDDVCFHCISSTGSARLFTASKQPGGHLPPTVQIAGSVEKNCSDFVLSFSYKESRPLSHLFSLSIETGNDLSTHFTLCCRSTRASDDAIRSLLDAFLHQLKPRSSHPTALVLSTASLNHPPTAPPSSLFDTLHAGFVKRAHESPNKSALCFLSKWSEGKQEAAITSLSYKDLATLSDRIAEMLMQLEMPRNTIVPIYAGPSVELYGSYLACLKAGLAFCPLPVDAPSQRINDMLQDVDARIVLSRGALPFAIGTPTMDLAPIVGDFLSTRSRVPHYRSCVEEVSPDSLAYVLYTSGSTGKPKGVQITHSAAVCSIASHMLCCPLPPHSRWFQFAAPTFDPSIMEIFVTLGSGHTLCSAERHLTLENVNRTVRDLGATVMMATPSMATLIDPDKIPTLRSLWTMGETLSDKLIDTFASHVDDGLINAYGECMILFREDKP